MNDYISREMALEAISEECKVCGPSGNCPFIMNCWIKQHRKALLNVPAADVRPVKWIPVTERLPENDDFVIIAVLDESGDTPYKYSDFGWYLEAANVWIVDAQQRRDVTHWMPLPEPPEGGAGG